MHKEISIQIYEVHKFHREIEQFSIHSETKDYEL